jgi:hypothetical protein
MPLASSAVSFDIGLLVTFLGIGVIANVLIVYAVAQALIEQRQNKRTGAGDPDSY